MISAPDRPYEAAHLLRNYNASALITRGNLAFRRGNLEEAEARYRQVLKLDPWNAGANNNLAVLYLSRGNNLHTAEQFALAALSQAGPLRPYVLETLAGVYLRQSRFVAACESLDEAEAAAPLDNKALHEQLTKTRERLPPWSEVGISK